MDAALAVPHVEVASLERHHRATIALLAGHIRTNGLQNLARRAVVGTGVHKARAAHRGGNAPQGLHAAEPRVGGGKGHVAQKRAGLRRHAPARGVELDLGQVVAQQHHHASDAAVTHQQVGPVAHHRHRHIAQVARIEHPHEGLGRRGRHHHVGGTADLERGVVAHGFGHEHIVLTRDLRQHAEHLLAHILVLVHRALPLAGYKIVTTHYTQAAAPITRLCTACGGQPGQRCERIDSPTAAALLSDADFPCICPRKKGRMPQIGRKGNEFEEGSSRPC